MRNAFGSKSAERSGGQERNPRSVALRIAGGYIVFSALWIFLSDYVLSHWASNLEAVAWWGMIKGWGFVGVTGGLLYLVLGRVLGRLERTRQGLAESEERFRLLVTAVPEYAIYLLDAEGRVATWNVGAERIKGWRAEEIIGQSFECFFRKSDREAGQPEALLTAARERGHVEEEGWRRRREGTEFMANVAVTALRSEAGVLRGYAKVTRDVTERRRRTLELERMNRLYATLSQVNQAIVRVQSRERLFADLCRAMVECGGFKLAWVGWLVGDTGELEVAASAGDGVGYLRELRITTKDEPAGHGPTGICLREGRTVVCDDFLSDPRMEPWRELAARHGLVASMAVPIRLGGQVRGALLAYAGERGFFGRKEVELMEEAAGDLSFAVDHLEQVAQRREAERSLAEATQRLQLALQVTRMGVWQWEIPTDRISTIQGGGPVSGLPAERYPSTGEAFLALVHPEDREDVRRRLQRAVQTGEPYQAEFRIVLAEGTERWVSARGQSAPAAGGRPQLMVGVDMEITERKQLELALHALTARTLRLQDEERRRLARELHDTIPQNLAALNMNLALLGRALPAQPARLRELLVDCEELTDRSAREIRTLSYLLHPPLLEEFGLARAVRDYVTGFGQRSGIRVELDLDDGLDRLPAEAELALFRVLQESLANVHRHSGSPVARVRLARCGEQVGLEVTDQGRGLPAAPRPGSAVPAIGVGILGMRERMRQLGGRLELSPASPGVCVRALLPVPLAPTLEVDGHR